MSGFIKELIRKREKLISQVAVSKKAIEEMSLEKNETFGLCIKSYGGSHSVKFKDLGLDEDLKELCFIAVNLLEGKLAIIDQKLNAIEELLSDNNQGV